MTLLVDIENQVITKLGDYLHQENFVEEFDFIYDSIQDTTDRRRGRNPMSEDYTNRVNKKRLEHGVTPLGANGLPSDNSSSEKALEWATVRFKDIKDSLWEYISDVLFELDPANTSCRENDCIDEYDTVANTVFKRLKSGEPLLDSLTSELDGAFGKGSYEVSKVKDIDDVLIKHIVEVLGQLDPESGESRDFVVALKKKTIDQILADMKQIQSVAPRSVMGAWGASICYKEMHKELDERGYDGERLSRQFSPPSMKQKPKWLDKDE